MKNYYDIINKDIRAFSLDGSQDFLITDNMILLEDETFNLILNNNYEGVILAEDNLSLIVVEKPSKYHVWNNDIWELNNDNLNMYKNELYDKLKVKREQVLEDGMLFEGDKLIKGRTQDLADATACFNMCASGLFPLTWFYSNGLSEEITTLDRMTSIYQSIGSFRTSKFSIEAKLKTQIKDITDIVDFDIDTLWRDDI